MEDVPQNIKKRGEILNNNGFGFQAPGQGTHDTFAICKLVAEHFPAGKLEDLRNTSGSRTADICDFLGRLFVTVRWDEHNKIKAVLDSLLKLGFSFYTNNKLQVCFCPKDGEFTIEKMEEKAVILYGSVLEHLDVKSIFCFPLFKTWNWTTEEGKKFCRLIREAAGKKPCDESSKHNYRLWPIFKNYDPETLADAPDINSSEAVFEEELCLVCYENKPDTMVLPCRHVVACRKCSEGLRGSLNARKCIKCRGAIETIIE